METTTDILRRFFTTVWEQGNIAAIDGFFDTSSCTELVAPDRPVEPAEVREWMEILTFLVRDIKVTFLHTVEQDNWAAAIMRVDCASKHTGKAVSVNMQIMSCQKDGKLVQSYPQFDLLRLFEQLDQLPNDAYALLMAGTRLH